MSSKKLSNTILELELKNKSMRNFDGTLAEAYTQLETPLLEFYRVALDLVENANTEEAKMKIANLTTSSFIGILGNQRSRKGDGAQHILQILEMAEQFVITLLRER